MSNPTRWVGIDLHRRRSFVTAINEEGELSFARRIVNDREAFLELLGEPEGTHVALEATYGWEWLAELLEDAGYLLHLAHPLRTRAIAAARVKTDAVDAKTLAHLLRAGLLPEAYIAPRELRDVRTSYATESRWWECAPRSRTVCTGPWPGTASPITTQICSEKLAASFSPWSSCARRHASEWTASCR